MGDDELDRLMNPHRFRRKDDPYLEFTFTKFRDLGTYKRFKAKPGSPLAKCRTAAHRAFDTIWQFGGVSRGEAYKLLAEEMGMRPEDCHVGMTRSVDHCRDIIEAARRVRARLSSV